MRRRRTRSAAWWALLAVFFAQLATAAYACPLIAAALSVSMPASRMSTPCADMDMDGPTDQAGLCVEHCKVGQQLVDTHTPFDEMAPVLAGLFYVITVVNDLSIRAVPVEPPLARATAPPIYASSSRLRI
jgi:hypothetical protein